MSELVEKVAQKMVDAYEAQFGSPGHVTDGMKARWKAFEPEARAAIKAVAEHLAGIGYPFGAEELLKQLEGSE